MIEHTIFYPFILSLPVTKANPRSYHFLNVHLSLFSTFYFCPSTSFLSFYTPPLHFFFYLPSSLSSTVRSSVRPLVPSRFQFYPTYIPSLLSYRTFFIEFLPYFLSFSISLSLSMSLYHGPLLTYDELIIWTDNVV